MYKYYGKRAPYLFLLPAAVVLILFFFIPFFQTIGLSFLDYSSNIYHAGFAGLKNYIDILHNPIFYMVMFGCYLLEACSFLMRQKGCGWSTWAREAGSHTAFNTDHGKKAYSDSVKDKECIVELHD